VANLLGTEPDGLGIDFTDTAYFNSQVWLQEWNQKRAAYLLTLSSPHTFYTNSGTSPKMVKTSATGLGWSPHNYELNSQVLGDASWTKTETTISTNATTAPDGSSTADLVVESSNSASHFIQSAATRAVGWSVVTGSVYAQYSGRLINFEVDLTGGASGMTIGVNLQTGAVDVAAATFGTCTLLDSGIEDAGGGWYRVWLTGQFASGSTNFRNIVNTYATPGAVSPWSYAGDGTSGAYLWGFQLNKGFLTAYINTTSAAVMGLPISYGEGLLVEPAATNLAVRSQEIDNASWTKSSATVSANATTAPDGSTTADTIVENAGVAFHNAALISVSFTAGTTYTWSAYAKKATGRDYCRLTFENNGSSQGVQAIANLRAGTVISSNYGGGETLVGANIESIGEGWYRVSVSGSLSVGTLANLYLELHNGSAASYNGDGSSGVHFWGSQFETGAVATSYVPTVAASSTRATDAVNVATSAYPHSDSAGTLVAWVRYRIRANTLSRRVFNINNGTSNESTYFAASNVGDDGFYEEITDGGASQGTPSTGIGILSLNGNKVAGFYALNDFGVLVDGEVSAHTDTSATMPTLTNLQLGYAQDVASRELNGFILRFAYFPSRMTTAQLRILTTTWFQDILIMGQAVL
jgi:hypothetical protein